MVMEGTAEEVAAVDGRVKAGLKGLADTVVQGDEKAVMMAALVALRTP